MSNTYEELECKIEELEQLIKEAKNTSITDCVFNGAKDSEVKANVASAVEAGMIALQGLAVSGAPVIEIH